MKNESWEIEIIASNTVVRYPNFDLFEKRCRHILRLGIQDKYKVRYLSSRIRDEALISDYFNG